MSPVSLSTPKATALHPGKHNPGIKFGAEPQPAKQPEAAKPADAPADTVEVGKPTEQASTEQAEKPAPKPPTFFDDLSQRINRFIERLQKAFKKLFGGEKPKTEVDKELKQLKQNLAKIRALNEQAIIAKAEQLEKSASPEELAKEKDFLEAAKTEDGRRKLLDALAPHKNIFEFVSDWNKQLEDPEAVSKKANQNAKQGERWFNGTRNRIANAKDWVASYLPKWSGDKSAADKTEAS